MELIQRPEDLVFTDITALYGQVLRVFKSLPGYFYSPFALLLGVPLADVPAEARLLGERTVATEVVAYQHSAEKEAAPSPCVFCFS